MGTDPWAVGNVRGGQDDEFGGNPDSLGMEATKKSEFPTGLELMLLILCP